MRSETTTRDERVPAPGTQLPHECTVSLVEPVAEAFDTTRRQPDFHPDFLGEMCRRLALKAYPDTRQFVVQHLFPDTVRLLQRLHRFIPIDTVIGISYSGNAHAIETLRALGIRGDHPLA